MDEEKHILKTSLYPFQRDAVERIKEFNGRCLLAMEMGLGKTLVSMCYAFESGSFPVVVVCPASLKFNWASEFAVHYGKKTRILSGREPSKCEPLPTVGQRVFIINYDVLEAWLPSLLLIRPSLVIFDESHYVKTIDAKRTRACATLAYEADRFLALTGTPMTNGNPMELYTTLNMIFGAHFCKKDVFEERYTRSHTIEVPIKRGRHWNKVKVRKYDGAKNMEELNAFLNNRCMIRKTVVECLPDLPPFARQTTLIDLEPKQRREYTRLEQEFEDWLTERYPDRKVPRSGMVQAMVHVGYMKRQVAEWKIPAVIEQIDTFLSGNDGKLIIFGIHRKILDAIWDRYAKKNGKQPYIVRIDGEVSSGQRQAAVHCFQNVKGTRLFLGQIVAAGTGLTLTASHHSLFAEVDFVPANHLQAEKRNYRIGTSNFVHFNYVIARDTIEDIVCNKLFKKQQTFNSVIEGKTEAVDTGNFDLMSSVLRAQLERMKK